MTALEFTSITLDCAPLGPEAPMPDLTGISNVQNQTRFELDEEDELYEGYGQRANGYPYRIYTEYGRELSPTKVEAAILENEWMRAVFLPGYGGRLWQLLDKTTGRNVVYTNDVLRASNLAVRGPWFSGGVEWNMGVIGHTPLTMEPIFSAELEGPEGPVLRLYSYERISGAVYQIDFWLDPQRPALNCHMSVTNPTADVIPMYWWSNIAMPLYPGGRVFVPAHKAYTTAGGTVHKVNIPMDDGVDVSRYEHIPTQRDYFFELDQGAPRWLAHVDAQGWGLLHSSTARLQSRKLFVWGDNPGGDHWQRFLTRDAGPYLEVQAGLAKTQYGCIPMAPHTTWQWTERYEPMDLGQAVAQLDFDETAEKISAGVMASDALERAEALGREIRCRKAEMLSAGLADGALENLVRDRQNLPELAQHLDFTSPDERPKGWMEYLETGVLPQPAADAVPAYDLTGKFWLACLLQDEKAGSDSWYLHYNLALLQAEADRMDLAEAELQRSLEKQQTPWAWYAKAVFARRDHQDEVCMDAAWRALQLRSGDAAFTKACLSLLAHVHAWQKMLDVIDGLDAEQAGMARIRFYRAQALYHCGEPAQALALLEADGGLELPDNRECEVAVGQLWQSCVKALTGKEEPIPEKMIFDAGALPQEYWDEV